MFDRYKRSVNEAAPDLNVIPVMNLFMVLIPFLLLGATFFQIGVIPTSLPTHNPTESDVPKTPKTVLVNLVVEEDEMRLTCDSVSLTPEELDDLAQTFPNSGGTHDIGALQAKLESLKTTYPESNTLTVIPHGDLQYQELVRVLDATREKDTGRVGPKGEPIFRELFPVTIFSKLVTEQPAAPAPEDGAGVEDGALPEEGGADEFGEVEAPEEGSEEEP